MAIIHVYKTTLNRGGEGAYFLSLEETGVERKGQKTDGIVSTVLSGDVAIIASITHLVKC